MKAFNYQTSSEFMTGFSDEEKLMLYGAYGGTPLYLQQINEKENFEENIQRALGNCVDATEQSLGISEVRNTIRRIEYLYQMESCIKEALQTQLAKPDVNEIMIPMKKKICYYDTTSAKAKHEQEAERIANAAWRYIWRKPDTEIKKIESEVENYVKSFMLYL